MDASPAPPPPSGPAASSSSGPYVLPRFPAPPPSSTANSQIRSRITVVCAECKRLKLKCDRRTPCGSCTKRDTVPRCIYSPAAAEKVDLHSLNNRLISVEGHLQQLTSGGFQSAYPLVPPPAPHAHAHHAHQHHHHAAAPRDPPLSSTLALSLPDICDLWLADLDLAVPLPSAAANARPKTTHSRRTSTSHPPTNYIKLEPSPADLDLAPPPPPPPPLPPRIKPKRPSPALHLPALTIYYPAPTIPPPTTTDGAFPHYPSSSASSTAGSMYTFPTTSSSPPQQHPQTTPDLLRLLPDLPTCVRLLEGAGEVLRVRPVPLWAPSPSNSNSASTSNPPPPTPTSAWPLFEKRLLRVRLGLDKEQREKEREARRARAILHHHSSSSPSTEDALDADTESLPLFACLCLALAVGSLVSPPGGGGRGGREVRDPVYYYALAQQALGVWDTQRTSAGLGGEEGKGKGAEELDYLSCCLMGVEFLVLRASLESDEEEKEGGGEEERGREEVLSADVGRDVQGLISKSLTLFRQLPPGPSAPSNPIPTPTPASEPIPLVQPKKKSSSMAKQRSIVLVNGAVLSDRGGKVGKGGREEEREKEGEKEWEREGKEEVRRMIWWGIVFWDLFVSDVLQTPPIISSPSASASSSTFKPVPLPACAWIPEDDEEEDRERDEMEDDEDFDLEDSGVGAGRKARFALVPGGVEKDGVSTGEREMYFGVRCRLAQLTQTIQHRLSFPDCCCGYTLDQAGALEQRMQRFLSALPAPLRFPSSSSLSSNGRKTNSNPGSASPPPAEEYLYPSSFSMDPDDLDAGNEVGGKENEARAAQAAELAVVANMLILRTYAPLLRGSPPAQHASLAAAKAVLRGCKALKDALAPSPGTHHLAPALAPVAPALTTFFPVANAAFAALAVCAHACFTRGGEAGREVGLGLDVLGELPDASVRRRVADAIRRRVERGGMANVLKRKRSQVDLLSSSSARKGSGVVELPTPTSRSGSMSRHVERPQPPPFSSSTSSSSATVRRRDDDAASSTAGSSSSSRKSVQDKEKRSKKLPQVGVRVRERGADGRPSSSSGMARARPQPSTSTSTGGAGMMAAPPQPTPLMTSVPRTSMDMGYPTSTTTPASASPQAQTAMGMMHGYRSRSSSISQAMAHAPPPPPPQPETSQSMDYPMPYGPPPMHEVRRYSVHELGPPPQPQQQQQQQQQPYVSPPVFSNPQRQSPFDTSRAYEHAHAPQIDTSAPASSAYNSPYQTGGQVSSTSSPYGSAGSGGGGHPPTPTFTGGSGVVSHHPSPPTFGSGSPTAYYQNHTGYEPAQTYDTTGGGGGGGGLMHQHSHPGMSSLPPGLPMDASSTSMDHSANAMVTSVPNTPIYEKTQQQTTMYDIKPAMDSLQHHPTHHGIMQAPSGYAEQQQQQQQHHASSGMPPQQAWPPPHQQQQHHQQQAVNVQQGQQQYWGATHEYNKFYSS